MTAGEKIDRSKKEVTEKLELDIESDAKICSIQEAHTQVDVLKGEQSKSKEKGAKGKKGTEGKKRAK